MAKETEFETEFDGYSDPYISLFVPGRICLFGEHTDWAGAFRRFNSSIAVGSTIVSGTNQGLFARVRKHSSKLIVHSILPPNLNPDSFLSTSPHHTIKKTGSNRISLSADMNITSLKTIASKGGFFSYAAGVACKILTDYKVSGLEVDNYKSTLPVAKGLSSSAAVCVLVARAFNRVFELKGTTRFEMEYAYSGENLTPSRCGRMDQACAFGQRPTCLTYDADDLDVQEISVGKPLHYLLVDLAFEGKSTTQILQGLQSAFPFPQDDTQKKSHHLFGAFNLSICERAIEALKNGDAAVLGSLMVEAQTEFQAITQPLCPSQLTMPLANKVLNHPPLQNLIFGGKGVGSQGDGTVQFLCKSESDRSAVADVLSKDFPNMTSLPLTLEPTGKIRKAVILAAGFGNNHYPATAAISVVFFPLVSSGVTKPALLIHVEELDSSGIEEIAIICQPSTAPQIRALFHNKLSAQNWSKLNPVQKIYAKKLKTLGLKVKIILQQNQEGMAHALSHSETFCNSEPFLLVISHHLMSSSTSSNCFTQLLKAFDSSNGNDMIGVRKIEKEDVSKYGVCKCKSYKVYDAMGVSEMKEKPLESYATANLNIEGLDDNYLSFFGIYALKAHIFPIISSKLKENARSEEGDFNLTDVLNEVNKHYEVNCYELEGERYDLTKPESYAEAVNVWSKK